MEKKFNKLLTKFTAIWHVTLSYLTENIVHLKLIIFLEKETCKLFNPVKPLFLVSSKMVLQYLKSLNSFNWGGMMPLLFSNFKPHYCSLFPIQFREQVFETGYKGHFQGLIGGFYPFCWSLGGSSSILYLPSDFRVAYAANISEHLPTQP